MDSKEKCRYAIKLAERAVLYLDDNAKKIVNEAIITALDWIQTECDVAEKLYNYLDNESNGFTILQESETDEIKISAWNCIIDAIAYVSRKAYEKKEVKYLPEPLEMADDSIFTHMETSLNNCSLKERKHI